MDASDLVSQMHETLSTMHMTLSSLSIAAHEAKLKYLEAQRDSALDALRAAFERESAELGGKRRAERETVAEQRRREDEERERRRRAEDEERERREDALDQERKARLADDTEEVEEEAEDLMAAVEEQAERLLIEGKMRLEELEARRKEINRLFDERLRGPLPAPPMRTRRNTRTRNAEPRVTYLYGDSDDKTALGTNGVLGPSHASPLNDMVVNKSAGRVRFAAQQYKEEPPGATLLEEETGAKSRYHATEDTHPAEVPSKGDTGQVEIQHLDEKIVPDSAQLQPMPQGPGNSSRGHAFDAPAEDTTGVPGTQVLSPEKKVEPDELTDEPGVYSVTPAVPGSWDSSDEQVDWQPRNLDLLAKAAPASDMTVIREEQKPVIPAATRVGVASDDGHESTANNESIPGTVEASGPRSVEKELDQDTLATPDQDRASGQTVQSVGTSPTREPAVQTEASPSVKEMFLARFRRQEQNTHASMEHARGQTVRRVEPTPKQEPVIPATTRVDVAPDDSHESTADEEPVPGTAEESVPRSIEKQFDEHAKTTTEHASGQTIRDAGPIPTLEPVIPAAAHAGAALDDSHESKANDESVPATMDNTRGETVYGVGPAPTQKPAVSTEASPSVNEKILARDQNAHATMEHANASGQAVHVVGPALTQKPAEQTQAPSSFKEKVLARFRQPGQNTHSTMEHASSQPVRNVGSAPTQEPAEQMEASSSTNEKILGSDQNAHAAMESASSQAVDDVGPAPTQMPAEQTEAPPSVEEKVIARFGQSDKNTHSTTQSEIGQRVSPGVGLPPAQESAEPMEASPSVKEEVLAMNPNTHATMEHASGQTDRGDGSAPTHDPVRQTEASPSVKERILARFRHVNIVVPGYASTRPDKGSTPGHDNDKDAAKNEKESRVEVHGNDKNPVKNDEESSIQRHDNQDAAKHDTSTQGHGKGKSAAKYDKESHVSPTLTNFRAEPSDIREQVVTMGPKPGPSAPGTAQGQYSAKLLSPPAIPGTMSSLGHEPPERGRPRSLRFRRHSIEGDVLTGRSKSLGDMGLEQVLRQHEAMQEDGSEDFFIEDETLDTMAEAAPAPRDASKRFGRHHSVSETTAGNLARESVPPRPGTAQALVEDDREDTAVVANGFDVPTSVELEPNEDMAVVASDANVHDSVEPKLKEDTALVASGANVHANVEPKLKENKVTKVEIDDRDAPATEMKSADPSDHASPESVKDHAGDERDDHSDLQNEAYNASVVRADNSVEDDGRPLPLDPQQSLPPLQRLSFLPVTSTPIVHAAPSRSAHPLLSPAPQPYFPSLGQNGPAGLVAPEEVGIEDETAFDTAPPRPEEVGIEDEAALDTAPPLENDQGECHVDDGDRQTAINDMTAAIPSPHEEAHGKDSGAAQLQPPREKLTVYEDGSTYDADRAVRRTPSPVPWWEKSQILNAGNNTVAAVPAREQDWSVDCHKVDEHSTLVHGSEHGVVLHMPRSSADADAASDVPPSEVHQSTNQHDRVDNMSSNHGTFVEHDIPLVHPDAVEDGQTAHASDESASQDHAVGDEDVSSDHETFVVHPDAVEDGQTPDASDESISQDHAVGDENAFYDHGTFAEHQTPHVHSYAVEDEQTADASDESAGGDGMQQHAVRGRHESMAGLVQRLMQEKSTSPKGKGKEKMTGLGQTELETLVDSSSTSQLPRLAGTTPASQYRKPQDQGVAFPQGQRTSDNHLDTAKRPSSSHTPSLGQTSIETRRRPSLRASARLRSDPEFEEPRGSRRDDLTEGYDDDADEFVETVYASAGEDDSPSVYTIDDEQITTVHGEEELFADGGEGEGDDDDDDDDDGENDAADPASDNVDVGHDDGNVKNEYGVLQRRQDNQPDDQRAESTPSQEGLAASRHNPDGSSTPRPRPDTNQPNGLMPRSLASPSTPSSASSLPLPVGSTGQVEPSIRSSWPPPREVGLMTARGRPRNESNPEDDYDPFRYGGTVFEVKETVHPSSESRGAWHPWRDSQSPLPLATLAPSTYTPASSTDRLAPSTGRPSPSMYTPSTYTPSPTHRPSPSMYTLSTPKVSHTPDRNHPVSDGVGMTGPRRIVTQDGFEYDSSTSDARSPRVPWRSSAKSLPVATRTGSSTPDREVPRMGNSSPIQTGAARPVTDSAPASPRSSLFQRVRNMFEQPTATNTAGVITPGAVAPGVFPPGIKTAGVDVFGKGSPVRSRPVSGIWYTVKKVPAPGVSPRSKSRTSSPKPVTDFGDYEPSEGEAENALDERSSLLKNTDAAR